CAGDSMAAKLCAENPKCTPYQLPSSEFSLPLPGKHNQWNAAAALALSKVWKEEQEILHTFENILPIRRRFETVYNQGGIRIVSDYAHHPSEVAALIQTARELKPKRLLGIFQPHRYTRTLALGPDFPDSFTGLDKLWLLPVYAASEQPVAGGTTTDLAKRFSAKWTKCLVVSSSMESAWNDVSSCLQDGDLLLIIGAGDIELLAERAKK
ncbi:MAG TPA: cyanophycin synthetase, partial [Pontiella sp.]